MFMSPEKRAEIVCPGCGSDRFDIHGSVPYTQRYYAQADFYDTSEVNWDADHPESVECAECYRDATQLFKKARIITRFYRSAWACERKRR